MREKLMGKAIDLYRYLMLAQPTAVLDEIEERLCRDGEPEGELRSKMLSAVRRARIKRKPDTDQPMLSGRRTIFHHPV